MSRSASPGAVWARTPEIRWRVMRPCSTCMLPLTPSLSPVTGGEGVSGVVGAVATLRTPGLSPVTEARGVSGLVGTVAALRTPVLSSVTGGKWRELAGR